MSKLSLDELDIRLHSVNCKGTYNLSGERICSSEEPNGSYVIAHRMKFIGP